MLMRIGCAAAIFWGPSAGLMRDQRDRRDLDHRLGIVR
jgi:hypothetical protein